MPANIKPCITSSSLHGYHWESVSVEITEWYMAVCSCSQGVSPPLSLCYRMYGASHILLLPPSLSLHLFFSPAVLIVSGTGKRERMNWSTCMSLLYFSAALVTHVLSSLLHSLLHGAKNPSADGPWNTNALHLQRVTLNLCFHKLKFVLSKKKRSKYLKEEFYKVKRSTGLNLKWNSRQHAT